MNRFFALAKLIDPKLFELPTTSNRLSKALDLYDLEELAAKRLPKFVFDYIYGSAYREEAAQSNRRALASRALCPRVLQGVAETSTAHTIMGKKYAVPVGVAPTGLTSLTHPEGELAGVRAAETAQVPFVLSTMSTFSIEEVASVAPEADKWFQLYLRKNRAESLALLNRAAKAGYSTLVLTVDTAVPGNRLRDTRNGLSVPPQLSLRNLATVLRRPTWSLNLLRSQPPQLANFGKTDGTLSELVAQMFDPDQSWTDFDLVRKHWRGHLVVKGVLHPGDAEEFVARGADAIWISNHGGRQLDRAVSPINTVAPIRAAVGPNVPLLFDSGIMSGSDIITAIGEGADFTFVGRGYLYGLAAGGKSGVELAFILLQKELKNTMQLLGIRKVAEITAEHVINVRSSEQKCNRIVSENTK